MTPCGWEGNRRSGVALAMRHRLQWFIHLRAHGLDREMSTPPTLFWSMTHLPTITGKVCFHKRIQVHHVIVPVIMPKTQVVTTQGERRWFPPSLALTPSLRTSSVELFRSNILRSEYSLQISFKYSNNSKLPEIVKQDYDSITAACLSSICSVTRIFVICYASRLLSVEPLRVHYGPCIVTSWYFFGKH